MSAQHSCSFSMKLLLIMGTLAWPARLRAFAFPDGETIAPSVLPNDNRRPAGEMRDGTLRLSLRAVLGGQKQRMDLPSKSKPLGKSRALCKYPRR